MKKNILVLLVLMLSPMVCYSEIPTEIKKPLKTEVKLGYELDHFSPIKTDSVKVSSTNKTNETEKINHWKFVSMSFAYAWFFYIACSSTLIGLLLFGGIILIVFKLVIL